MKKTFLLSTFFFALMLSTNAQVPKKAVVEHFTNSKCSICASRNPGFYVNYRNQSNVLHLAIHPSSPYTACIFSQQNVAENDARTNYYGVYGGTPRLAINGVVIPGGDNYEANALFTPYLGQNSPASIKISQSKYGNDSIRSRIVIKTEALHNLGNLKLFVALAEDTIFYNAPNGENKHFDVFRKSLTGATGITVNLPSTIGDSVIFTMSSPVGSTWNFSRIYTMAILQEASNQALVQSESVSAKSNLATGIKTFMSDNTVQVFVSNEINRTIVISRSTTSNDLNFTLYDLNGRKIIQKKLEGGSGTINVTDFTPGIYLFDLSTTNGVMKRGKLLFTNTF